VMTARGVGVTPVAVYELKRVDSDFFAEALAHRGHDAARFGDTQDRPVPSPGALRAALATHDLCLRV
jgi:hypothetical protein